ncbi:hypothetical protein CPB84DRAFT_1779609 [Gymnopilus junonius]|uniref:C2H2-type domain-containing protein n=1 Tax=Gymnopilus junonius TaxID=109634 RepID=A0A9P5TLS2_GYMJU|nr:hypothetical protein CPB84DRAFT_1779609 [Gymnopilus junonius]
MILHSLPRLGALPLVPPIQAATHCLYTLQDAHATLSSASLAYSDSGASSLLDFFPYSPSPQTSSSPSPVVGPLTLFSSQEDHLSYPLTPSPTISVSDDPFLTSGPFEHYPASSPSPSHSFGHPLPSSEPPQPIGISEASECQSHLDPANIRAQLLHTFSPDIGDPNAGTLKTLFSKNAKTSVSTPAGRAASALRRKHPARFACQFCDATFTRKLGLENHNKSHLGITDQQCRFCLKLFPNSLPRHMKRCKDNPERIAPRKIKNIERGRVSESQSSVV